MAKFIEIHAYGTKDLLNLDSVTTILESSDGKAIIHFSDGEAYLEPEETYSQLREMIASAQGGIPINTWRSDDGK